MSSYHIVMDILKFVGILRLFYYVQPEAMDTKPIPFLLNNFPVTHVYEWIVKMYVLKT